MSESARTLQLSRLIMALKNAELTDLGIAQRQIRFCCESIPLRKTTLDDQALNGCHVMLVRKNYKREQSQTGLSAALFFDT